MERRQRQQRCLKFQWTVACRRSGIMRWGPELVSNFRTVCSGVNTTSGESPVSLHRKTVMSLRHVVTGCSEGVPAAGRSPLLLFLRLTTHQHAPPCRTDRQVQNCPDLACLFVQEWSSCRQRDPTPLYATTHAMVEDPSWHLGRAFVALHGWCLQFDQL